jgi:hypothetical protein
MTSATLVHPRGDTSTTSAEVLWHMIGRLGLKKRRAIWCKDHSSICFTRSVFIYLGEIPSRLLNMLCTLWSGGILSGRFWQPQMRKQVCHSDRVLSGEKQLFPPRLFWRHLLNNAKRCWSFSLTPAVLQCSEGMIRLALALKRDC